MDVSGELRSISTFFSCIFLLVRRIVIPGVLGAVTVIHASLKQTLCIKTILYLKEKYNRMRLTDKNKFEKLAVSHCNFLFNNYTNIFNRLIKDEMNIQILYKFIEKLSEVEEGITDQHTASVEIGKILKELYIDSALRSEKNYEQDENGVEVKKNKKPINNITWGKFKAMGLAE